MTPFNHFDFLAPYYDRFVSPRNIEQFATIANLPSSGVLIDVGGGTGLKSVPLLSMVEKIIVVDSSLGMLAQARQKSGLICLGSESEHLPLASSSIDRIIMVDAFHHVLDHKQTISELWRVTRPGGRIIIEEPDIRSFSVKIMALIEKVALMRSHFISPQGITEFFEYPGAMINTLIEESTAWIIVDKQIHQ